MATVISLYDDETGQHIKTFMIQPKPNRRIISRLGVLVGLMLAPLVFGWLKW